MEEPLIRTVDLSVAYRVGANTVRALSGVNLSIWPGEICCLLGPSGSGKSTLLNQLAGLEKPTRGEIFIHGENITEFNESRLTRFRRANMGFIFQSYNLLAQLSAIENVALPLIFRRIPKYARLILAKKELARLGLVSHAEHLPSQLSGGQQQRVGIARAFITRPQIIFADEPTGNLDSAATRMVLEMMVERCKRQNTALVMVTHEQELALCADHIVQLLDGKIVGENRYAPPEANRNRSRLFSQREEIA